MICTFCFFANVKAEYRSFIEPNKQWIVIEAYYWIDSIAWTKKYFIDGDTLVGTKLCQKLMLCTKNYAKETIQTEFLMSVYEDNRKVFCYPSGSKETDSPILLYDFTAIPGDTVLLGGLKGNLCQEKKFRIWETVFLENQGNRFNGLLATNCEDSVIVENRYELYSFPLYVWYERIGSIIHPFEQTMNMSSSYLWLYECKVGEEVIYSHNKGIMINDTEETSISFSPVIEEKSGSRPIRMKKNDIGGFNLEVRNPQGEWNTILP